MKERKREEWKEEEREGRLGGEGSEREKRGA